MRYIVFVLVALGLVACGTARAPAPPTATATNTATATATEPPLPTYTATARPTPWPSPTPNPYLLTTPDAIRMAESLRQEAREQNYRGTCITLWQIEDLHDSAELDVVCTQMRLGNWGSAEILLGLMLD